jgi:hypothetical protein
MHKVAVSPQAIVHVLDSDIISQNHAMSFQRVVNKGWLPVLGKKTRGVSAFPKLIVIRKARNELTDVCKHFFGLSVTADGACYELDLQKVLTHLLQARRDKFFFTDKDGKEVARIMYSADATPQGHRGFTGAGVRVYMSQHLNEALCLLFFEGADTAENTIKYLTKQAEDVSRLRQEGVVVYGAHVDLVVDVVADLKGLETMHGPE